jgi:hypothetical protein
MVTKTTLRWREAGSSPAWCTNMKHTLARRAFKEHLGQANHFLITTLVALDCLNNHQNFNSAGLHAAWSPKDVSASVQRSRIFAMHSFLGTAVDALDVYFSLLGRKPDFLQDERTSQALQACHRSVYKKAQFLATLVPCSSIESALIEVLITWRNNVMHELADNKLSDISKQTLERAKNEISESYRGLDVSQLSFKAECGGDLTFKETASLINAAHKFVEKSDQFILDKLDLSRLYTEVLIDTLQSNPKNHVFRARLFDVEAPKWASFVSNWASNTLRTTPLTPTEIAAIRSIIPDLRSPVG